MCQITVTIITLPVTAVCPHTLTTTTTVTILTDSGKNDVVLPPPLIQVDTVKDVAGSTTVPQPQPQSQIPSQAHANYAMGPSWVNFLLQS